jgi:Dolichyl-phosphate-mannose-protein mannosyltransferase
MRRQKRTEGHVRVSVFGLLAAYERGAAASARLRDSARARLPAAVRGNKLFALLLAAGAALRLLAMVGYPGMVWFPGDSYLYLGAALRPVPDLSKTVGYSFFLRALLPLHSLIVVSLVQHLMGLAVAVLLYVLMRRSGVARHWAALLSAPVLLDGNQIALEHMVMAETLFTFLIVVAVALLLWRPRPAWQACLAAGLLTGYAITVRSEGLPVPLLLAAFVLVRRIGWRQLSAVLAGAALPVAGYLLWFHAHTGTWGLTRSEGFYLWGRVSTFAECGQIQPPPSERGLCLPQPPAQRLPPGQLIWLAPQVHSQLQGSPVGKANDSRLRDFAIRAVAAQPLGYAHAIADGLVLAVDWRRIPYPSEYTTSHYYFHRHPQVLPGNRAWIHGGTPAADAVAYGRAPYSRVFLPAALPVAAWQRLCWTYGPLFGAILLLGLVGVARARRQGGGPGLLPAAAAMVLLVFPIAVADFDYRYLLPVLPFACLAAGLAFAQSLPGPITPSSNVGNTASVPAVGSQVEPAQNR